MPAHSKFVKVATVCCSVLIAGTYVGYRASKAPAESKVPATLVNSESQRMLLPGPKSAGPELPTRKDEPIQYKNEEKYPQVEVPKEILDAAARADEEQKKNPRTILLPGSKDDARLFRVEDVAPAPKPKKRKVILSGSKSAGVDLEVEVDDDETAPAPGAKP